MLRHARDRIASLGLPLGCALALCASLAGAQTIADYSRAQRSMLESVMSQAAARSAGLGASAPAAVASAAVAAPLPSSKAPMLPTAPAVQVSGVFAARDGAVVEVVVDATAYLLGTGQGVPGTVWHVESIAPERVVLARQGAGPFADLQGVRKVFALPALR